jgi:4-amino-4-deoxy-L-arabinose transferase-like glycosyltransferase
VTGLARVRVRDLVILSAILLLSGWARLHDIGQQSYWYDEMVSLGFARAEEWSSVFWDNAPPLYYVFLKLWIAVFGLSEVATRSLSALFSIAATAWVVGVGFELRGRRGAWVSGLCHALLVLSIQYAQETRMYSLFELGTAANFYYLIRCMKMPSRRDLWGYGLTGLLLSLTHYLAVVPLALGGCSLLFQRSSKEGSSRLKPRVGLWVVGGLALLVIFYLLRFKWHFINWQVNKYHLEPDARWPLKPILSLAGGSAWTAGALGTLLLAGAKGARDRVQSAWLAAMVCAPIVLVTVVGLLGERALSLPRYYVYLTPYLAAWAGLSLCDLSAELSRRAALAFVSVFLVLWGIGGLGTAYEPRKEDWRSAARRVASTPRSVVYSYNFPGASFPYFKSFNLETHPWLYWSAAEPTALLGTVRARGAVWFVETASNAGYFSLIESWAGKEGLGVHLESMSGPGQPSLEMMMLYEKRY